MGYDPFERYCWVRATSSGVLARWLLLGCSDSTESASDSASGARTGAGGGATGGWLLHPGHDADGAAGYPEDQARWVVGMVHEQGHAFDLPDSTSTDGTCLSASFYGWPDCIFTQAQKDSTLSGRWGTGVFLF